MKNQNRPLVAKARQATASKDESELAKSLTIASERIERRRLTVCPVHRCWSYLWSRTGLI